MAKNYFNRYVWLLDTIHRHGHITLAEISRQWQLSSLNEDGSPMPERTFHNHKDAIAETFGIEIKSDRSLGYYIANNEELEGSGIREWLLESMSLNNLLNESSDMKDRILFEKIPSSQRWLQIIVNAMRDGKALEMTYQSFWRNSSNTYETHPYCLKLFKQRWYMLAKSIGKPEVRVYALDRIQDLKILSKTLKVPANFSAEEFFSNYFGIIVGSGHKACSLKIKVAADQVKYFDSLPLHHSQTAVERNAEYTVYEYHLVPTFDFKQEILGHGPAVEVLSPEWFREEVKRDIDKMSHLYH